MTTGDLRRTEKWSWATGLVGQNLIFSLQLNFALFAFVEILGLLPAAVGTMLFLARVFDGFNDPIMGVVADRTRTRWGRFRPWLILVPVPIAVATALMFYDPGLSYGATLAYAYIVYFVWSILYTLSDIPLWALSSAMTRKSEERTSIVSLGRVGSFVGILLPAILVPVIAGAVAPDDQGRGYFLAAAVFAVMGIPLMMTAGFGTRERVEIPEERPQVRDMWEGFKINRPLQILVVSSLLGALAMGAQGVFPFFAQYNLGDDTLVAALAGVTIPGIMIGVALTGFFTKRLGKVGTVVWMSVIRAALLAAWYFVGWESLPVTLAFIALMAFTLGPWTVHLTTMIGDSVDMVELETGKRHEGVAFSLQTLSAKVVTGIGALVTGAVLTWTGYVANQDQSPEALNGIFLMLTLIPAVSSLLSIIPFRWYTITEASHEAVVADLEAREAEHA